MVISVPDLFRTHEVLNQAKVLADYNSYLTDQPLQNAVASFNGNWAETHLAKYGAITGGEMITLGFDANENKPKLKSHDRFGVRLDEVIFHPSYHRIMALGTEHGVSNFAWRHEDQVGAHVARAALLYMHCQPEAGTACPLTMTYATVPSLRLNPKLADWLLPKVMAPDYDHRLGELSGKAALTIGMGMTEKQGGSDVRANTTYASFLSQDAVGDVYSIVGHKWFFSAPMCDAFLVLAQTSSGLSCFLMPRIWTDRESNVSVKNEIRIQRLKEKLGNWSNASSEVEFTGAKAWLVGQEGRGVNSILEMVALTRLDCMLGSAGIMRQALVQAIHHTRARYAFGKPLAQQPLMMNVLADLALESEAAVLLSMRVAYAVDRSASNPHEAAIARLATAVGKYWICKRATPFINEAQECMGGAGYVEESIMPRLMREAPLNSIWEGSGNVQCLDVLRAISREPDVLEAFMLELHRSHGMDSDLDAAVIRLKNLLKDLTTVESRARQVVEQMALVLQGHLLIQHTPSFVAKTFCKSRFGGQHGEMLGTLNADAPFQALIDRAFPQ